MVLGKNPIRIVGNRAGVAVFDQQPVCTLAAKTIALHSHEHPAPVESLSLEPEFELTRAQLLGSGPAALGAPEAAVPELHGSAPIFATRDRPLEVSVVEGMVLHFHRQAFLSGIQRRSARHGPGSEDSVQLEPQIVMKPPRGMLLNDEA